jgi:hypothetical protein
MWIGGATLYDIECHFGTLPSKAKKCDNARDFVLRIVPDLAYLASLPELIRKATDDSSKASLSFSQLSGCIREGLDTVEKLALFKLRRKSGARVGCHIHWSNISPWVAPQIPNEDWTTLYRRVKLGMQAADS